MLALQFKNLVQAITIVWKNMEGAEFPNNNGANVQFKLYSHSLWSWENKLLKSLALWFNRILFELHLNCTPLLSAQKKANWGEKQWNSGGVGSGACRISPSILTFWNPSYALWHNMNLLKICLYFAMSFWQTKVKPDVPDFKAKRAMSPLVKAH